MKNVKKFLALALVALVVLFTFAACGKSPQKAILGTWRDSANTKGYTFNEDNSCVIKIAPSGSILGLIKYDGDINGVYTVEEMEDGTCYVTITYTLYSKSYTEKYQFSIEGVALTMINTADQTSTVYMAYEEPETTSAAVSDESTTAAVQ